MTPVPTLKELSQIVHRILAAEIQRLAEISAETGLLKETTQLKIYAEMIDMAREREIRFGKVSDLTEQPTEKLASRFEDVDL